jgi:hypothetical protein
MDRTNGGTKLQFGAGSSFRVLAGFAIHRQAPRIKPITVSATVR